MTELKTLKDLKIDEIKFQEIYNNYVKEKSQ